MCANVHCIATPVASYTSAYHLTGYGTRFILRAISVPLPWDGRTKSPQISKIALTTYSSAKNFAMPTTDPRIDAYIENHKTFAKPILKHLRALCTRLCPAEETMRGVFPNYFTRAPSFGNMASFKQHCAFGLESL